MGIDNFVALRCAVCMTKRYRDDDSRQTLLLPPSLDEWLPEDHLARFVLDTVAELDLGAIEGVIQSKDSRGERPYSPRMMVALLFYAYATGTFSSRRIATACVENVAFRVVSGNCQPHFTVIAGFRRRHLDALKALFAQVHQLCKKAGLIEGEHLHLDGTKLQANASKHKAMSYDGMLKAEARIEQEIAHLFDQAEAADRADDANRGEGQAQDDDVEPEVKRRETRLAWIRRMRAELEAEARNTRAEELRAQAEEQRRKAEDEADPVEEKRQRTRARTAEEKAAALAPASPSAEPAPAELPSAEPASAEPPPAPPLPEDVLPEHRPETTTDGKPAPGAQRNFTDPDSRIMLDKRGGYTQCYNAQIVADESSHVIVAHGLGNQAPDSQYLSPMLARACEALEAAPQTLTADAGYAAQVNIAACLHRDVRPYLAVGRERTRWPPPPVAEGAPPRGASATEWMAWMLRTPEGQTRMRKRKSTVELIFGCIKEAMNFRRFLLRGIEKVRAEWALVCLAYNLRKLHTAAVR